MWRGRRKWPLLGHFCINLKHTLDWSPDRKYSVYTVFSEPKFYEIFKFGVRFKVWAVYDGII